MKIVKQARFHPRKILQNKVTQNHLTEIKVPYKVIIVSENNQFEQANYIKYISNTKEYEPEYTNFRNDNKEFTLNASENYYQ